MDRTRQPERGAEEGSPTADPLRAEAEERAHDRVAPHAVLDAAASVNLYVEAFTASTR